MSSTTDELQRSWKEDPENKTKLFRYMKAMEREGRHLSVLESFRIALLLSPDVSQLEYNMQEETFEKIRFMIDDVSIDEANRFSDIILESGGNVEQTPMSKLIAIQLEIARYKESEYKTSLSGRNLLFRRYLSLYDNNIIQETEYDIARSMIFHGISANFIRQHISNKNEISSTLPVLIYIIKEVIESQILMSLTTTAHSILSELPIFRLSLIQYSKSLLSMPQWEKLDRLDKIRYLTILKILGPYAKPASKVVKNIKNQASKIRFGDDHDMSMSYAVNTGLDIDISKSCDDVLQAINR